MIAKLNGRELVVLVRNLFQSELEISEVLNDLRLLGSILREDDRSNIMYMLLVQVDLFRSLVFRSVTIVAIDTMRCSRKS